MKLVKISEIENKISNNYDNNKYITTQKINMLTTENYDSRLAQANTASKNDTANLLSKAYFACKLKSVNKLSEKVKLLSSSWNVIYK